MRKDRPFVIVLPTTLFLVGAYLLHESLSNSKWYMDFVLIAGAALSVIGLMTASWTIPRRLSTRRLK